MKQITSLDGNERKLNEEMLVIADPDGAGGSGRRNGGLASEVTDQTSSILLEAAYFNPTNIRRTSRALALRSEASSRFERGIDITGCRRAADRAARLLLVLSAVKLSGVYGMFIRPDRVEDGYA